MRRWVQDHIAPEVACADRALAIADQDNGPAGMHLGQQPLTLRNADSDAGSNRIRCSGPVSNGLPVEHGGVGVLCRLHDLCRETSSHINARPLPRQNGYGHGDRFPSVITSADFAETFG
jgi:hypothetical protein